MVCFCLVLTWEVLHEGDGVNTIEGRMELKAGGQPGAGGSQRGCAHVPVEGAQTTAQKQILLLVVRLWDRRFQGLGLLIQRTENRSLTDLPKKQNNFIQSKSIAQIQEG